MVSYAGIAADRVFPTTSRDWLFNHASIIHADAGEANKAWLAGQGHHAVRLLEDAQRKAHDISRDCDSLIADMKKSMEWHSESSGAVSA